MNANDMAKAINAAAITFRIIVHLDRDVIAISWSEPDRRLYAIAHDPVPVILVYRLP